MKRILRDEMKKKPMLFPVQITIQYSEMGLSLMVLHTPKELDEYLKGRDIADSVVRSIRRRNNKTYVEADTEEYAEIREILYPYKPKKKEDKAPADDKNTNKETN